MFEFVIPRGPVSVQARDKRRLSAWKDYVRRIASQEWSQAKTIQDEKLQITLVYFCEESPLDIDNIIKPIQDALKGLVYTDDSLVSDVDGHRRMYDDQIDIASLPDILIASALKRIDCVYVRVRGAKELKEYL